MSNLRSGFYGLPKTFWTFGVLIPTGAQLAAGMFLLMNPSDRILPFVSLPALAVAVWYSVTWIQGCWRAATDYGGSVIWAFLAKVAVAMFAVYILASAAFFVVRANCRRAALPLSILGTATMA